GVLDRARASTDGRLSSSCGRGGALKGAVMHRVHVRSKSLSARAALAALTLAGGIGTSCAVAPESESGPEAVGEEEVGEAKQAATTCVTIQKGQPAPWGTVEDAHVAIDTSDPLQVKANKNYGGSQAFTTSLALSGANYVARIGLVRWDISGIPANVRIDSA